MWTFCVGSKTSEDRNRLATLYAAAEQVSAA